jgi:hypothetical protein
VLEGDQTKLCGRAGPTLSVDECLVGLFLSKPRPELRPESRLNLEPETSTLIKFQY